MTTATLGQVILSAINRFSDLAAVADDRISWTYRQFSEHIARAVGVFKSLGLTRGDGVALLCGNRLEALTVQYAAVLMGLRYTALHPLASKDTHAAIVLDAEIKALVFDPGSVSYNVPELAESAPLLQHVLAFGSAAGSADLLHAMQAAVPESLTDEARPGDTAFLYYTGGTTGVPKGVMLSHRSLLALTLLQASDWDLPKQQIHFLAVTPISHASGVILPTIFLKGGSVRITAGFSTTKFCDIVKREKVSMTFLVPTMIYALLDDPNIQPLDVQSLETIVYGAAPISPHRLARAIERFGGIFMQLYGQTEAPMCITTLRKSDHDVSRMDRLASCGLPSPLVQVRLFDGQMREMMPGQPGEICVRGPLVMDGYWHREEATREAFHDGWLHTGDVAVQSPDGYFTIVDRTKDMIISGGFNIYPTEVEDALLSHPEVSLCAVIGVADPKWGEAVIAYVVRRPDTSVDDVTLKAHVKAKRGAIWAPKTVYFVDAVPLTALGKIDRKMLRKLHAQNHPK